MLPNVYKKRIERPNPITYNPQNLNSYSVMRFFYLNALSISVRSFSMISSKETTSKKL